MKAFNLETFQLVKTIIGAHDACVLSLAVAGNRMYSGSYDTSIKVRYKFRLDAMLIPPGLGFRNPAVYRQILPSW